MLLLCLVITSISYISGYSYGKIVNGKEVDISEYPYQAYISPIGCGGSIITEKYIITAGHCMSQKIPETIVQVGTSTLGDGGQVLSVLDSIVHPDYSYITSDNDIAVVILKDKIVFNKNAKPIALYLDDMPVGAWCDVTGFGKLEQSSSEVAGKLNHVKLQILSYKSCRFAYLFTLSVTTDSMFCAGYFNGEADTCQGDSGGPVAVDGKLVGVVSWGYGCAEVGYPGVYTNIRRMIDFIQTYIPI